MRYRLRTLLIVLAVVPAVVGVTVGGAWEAYKAAVAIATRRDQERAAEAKAQSDFPVAPNPQRDPNP